MLLGPYKEVSDDVSIICYDTTIQPDKFKLILRPISDLTRD
jgi:hypothetical protein